MVAAFVETYLLPTATGTFIMVGLIEELTKALIVVVVASRLVTRRPCDGMVFGATVGAGFAAFESAGYAFATLIEHQEDHPILNILSTEAFRGVLSPFGHITWTAIFGGALFAAAAADGRLRVTWPLVGTTAASSPCMPCGTSPTAGRSCSPRASGATAGPSPGPTPRTGSGCPPSPSCSPSR